LYLLCLRESRPELDAILADALLLCVRQQLGLPPSLFGGNAEARGNAGGRDTPQSTDKDLIIANLGSNGQTACLVVNAGDRTISLKTALCSVPPGWNIPESELSPGAYLRIEA